MSKQNKNFLSKPETLGKAALIVALGALAIAEGPRALRSGQPEKPSIVKTFNTDGHYQGTGHAEWAGTPAENSPDK